MLATFPDDIDLLDEQLTSTVHSWHGWDGSVTLDPHEKNFKDCSVLFTPAGYMAGVKQITLYFSNPFDGRNWDTLHFLHKIGSKDNAPIGSSGRVDFVLWNADSNYAVLENLYTPPNQWTEHNVPFGLANRGKWIETEGFDWSKITIIAFTFYYPISPDFRYDQYNWLERIYFYTGSPPPSEYILTVSSNGEGTTDPPSGSYTSTTPITVTAIPNTGYRLAQWTLDNINAGSSPTITVTMDRNRVLMAIFEYVPVQYVLTISSSSGGSTSLSPGQHSYEENTAVSVQAVADSGYYFDHWSLDGIRYGATSIYVLMDTNHTLEAFFQQIPPSQGILQCNAYINDMEISANVEVSGVGTYTTPFSLALDPNEYTLKATYLDNVQTRITTILENQTATETFQFIMEPKTNLVPFYALAGIGTLLAVACYSGRSSK